MEKSIKLDLVYSTRNNVVYKGRMANYQAYGNRKSDSPYNTYQDLLYNRVLYGLDVFTKEELQMMHWEKKKRIIKVSLRTKEILNIWKQEITNEIFDRFFKPKFINTKTEFAKELIELYPNETDPELENRISFGILGITKKDIITKLIEKNILPRDFYELKPVYRGLPRLISVNSNSNN